MAYKIYGKGNYVFLDDTSTGIRHEELKKNVFVQVHLISENTYWISPFKSLNGQNRTKITSTQILKENGTPYTDAEWVTFYTENTGNFNGGAGGTQTVVVENYAALPLPSLAVDEFYFVKNSQGTKWLPWNLGGTYYSNGLYYSDGIEWFYTNLPYQADLPTVNLGTNTSEFLTPYTFDNSNKILNSFQKNVDTSDNVTEGAINLFMTQAEKDAIENQTDHHSGQNIIESGEVTTIDEKKEMFVSKLKIDSGGKLDINGRTTVSQGVVENNGIIVINGILRII